MNNREKAAKEALAKKHYKRHDLAFQVTKKGARSSYSVQHDISEKIGKWRSIRDSIAELRGKR